VDGCGTIFEISTTGGTPTILHNFDGTDGFNGTDGSVPLPGNGLVQATNGTIYGTTFSGGTHREGLGDLRDGTVFSLTVTGLNAFVKTLPLSAKVGAAVKILGTGLTGATSVSFSGTEAAYTVVSDSEITTTVPAGATSGFVTVNGTLASNTEFRVTPQITSFTPPSGPVGTSVTITGVSLTQTTKVTFGGVKATSFTVDSDTQITVPVPTGAVTGKIVITTPGGTAASATAFTVTAP